MHYLIGIFLIILEFLIPNTPMAWAMEASASDDSSYCSICGQPFSKSKRSMAPKAPCGHELSVHAQCLNACSTFLCPTCHEAVPKTCCICLDRFAHRPKMKRATTLLCPHNLHCHQQCLQKWLTKNNCCPICRTNIAIENPSYHLTETEMLLLDSALTGNLEGIQAAIAAEVNITVQDFLGDTALHLAIRKEDLNAVNLLLHAAGPHIFELVTKTNRDGETALHWAVAYHVPEIVNRLLTIPHINPVHLITRRDHRQRTVLHTAAAEGYPDIETLLNIPGINSETLIRSKDIRDYTPLHLAAQSRNPTTFLALLNTPGIDKEELVSTQTFFGDTVLHIAAYAQSLSIIRIILNLPEIDKMALLSKQNNEGDTVLHIATRRNNLIIAALLCTSGIDRKQLISIQNNYRETPYSLALTSCNPITFTAFSIIKGTEYLF